MVGSFGYSVCKLKRTLPALLAVCTLLGTPLLSAQDTPRNLTGMVSDRQHEPLRGAIVQVENQATHDVLSFITDKTGHYNFKRLAGNADYNVWATFRDQRSKTKTLSAFNTHQEVTIDLEIDPR